MRWFYSWMLVKISVNKPCKINMQSCMLNASQIIFQIDIPLTVDCIWCMVFGFWFRFGPVGIRRTWTLNLKFPTMICQNLFWLEVFVISMILYNGLCLPFWFWKMKMSRCISVLFISPVNRFWFWISSLTNKFLISRTGSWWMCDLWEIQGSLPWWIICLLSLWTPSFIFDVEKKSLSFSSI